MPDQDRSDSRDELLPGGVANAGAVERRGDQVFRPAPPHAAAVHDALARLAAAGFDGAPRPIGFHPDGREVLTFVVGEVALPPYPAWVQTDEALASIVRLLRRLHDASTALDLSGSWNVDTADPAGGPVLCHNDVCLENVVFRDGEAVALIDFDHAAPGRRLYDLASFARMCVPVDDPVNATRLGWSPADLPRRLRVVADTYGLSADERSDLLTEIDASIQRAEAFVRRHVDAGHPGFVEMWRAMGGQARFDRRADWWASTRPTFAAALDTMG